MGVRLSFHIVSREMSSRLLYRKENDTHGNCHTLGSTQSPLPGLYLTLTEALSTTLSWFSLTSAFSLMTR